MSYPYRVRVAKVVKRDIKADDKVKNTLQIDEVVDTPETNKLIEEALEKRGYEKQGDGTWIKELESGERRAVDVEKREVESSVELDETISKEKTLEITGTGDAYSQAQRDAQQAEQKKEAKAQLARTLKISDEEIETKRQELVKKIGKVLGESAEERKRELLEVVAEVQAESLKKKAAQLGSIVSIEENLSEDGQDYELRIKIAE